MFIKIIIVDIVSVIVREILIIISCKFGRGYDDVKGFCLGL